MDFFQLQPEDVIRAVELKGFSLSGHIQPLNSLENRVFDLRQEDGSHLVVKFYRPGRWNTEAIAEEHRLLFALEDAEVPVCSPITRDGQSLFEHQGYCFAIWPRTGGRLIDEFTPELLYRIGGHVARIHRSAASLEFHHRPKLDAQYMVTRHKDFLFEQQMLPDKHRKTYLNHAQYLEAAASNMSKACDYQCIHGDCHTGNMLLGDEGLFFLDFDDCMSGPAVQDLWMVVSDQGDAALRKRDAFLNGYERFANFPQDQLKYSELLRALRYLAYNGWIARRSDDPAISRAFPDFGSMEYWDQFMFDLDEQIERIEQDSGYQAAGVNLIDEEIAQAAAEAASEDELSDEDYFFDLDDGRWSPGQ